MNTFTTVHICVIFFSKVKGTEKRMMIIQIVQINNGLPVELILEIFFLLLNENKLKVNRNLTKGVFCQKTDFNYQQSFNDWRRNNR